MTLTGRPPTVLIASATAIAAIGLAAVAAIVSACVNDASEFSLTSLTPGASQWTQTMEAATI